MMDLIQEADPNINYANKDFDELYGTLSFTLNFKKLCEISLKDQIQWLYFDVVSRSYQINPEYQSNLFWHSLSEFLVPYEDLLMTDYVACGSYTDSQSELFDFTKFIKHTFKVPQTQFEYLLNRFGLMKRSLVYFYRSKDVTQHKTYKLTNQNNTKVYSANFLYMQQMRTLRYD